MVIAGLVAAAAVVLALRSRSRGTQAPDVVSGASVAGNGDSDGADVSWQTPRVVDGEALRARTRRRLEEDLSAVVGVRGGSRKELGERLCERVVPRRPEGTPILIRPNIGGFEGDVTHGAEALRGHITEVDFVRGVIACLKRRGHTNITVADGWHGTHREWEALIVDSGYAALAKEEGVLVVAMNDDGVFDREGSRPGLPLPISGMEATSVSTLKMPKVLADHLEGGLVIAVPKIKAHRYAVFSLALKGVQGSVLMSDKKPMYRQKWRMHRELSPIWGKPAPAAAFVATVETFAKRIADVFEVEAPDVVLAEGTPVSGGDGFHVVQPIADELAIGGTNPILVDRIGAEILGLWANADLARELGGHATSPLLEEAARRFHVSIEAPLVDETVEEILRTARPIHYVSVAPPFEIHRPATER